MVENSVCPALFLTAGRGSTHNSPSLEYRHIHCRSEGGTGFSYLVPTLLLSLVPSLAGVSASSSAVRIFSRCCDKKSEMFHCEIILNNRETMKMSLLLYRHECFTGKYTTSKIHKNYIRDPSGLFSIISHVSLSMT